MRGKKRPLLLLVIGLLSFACLFYLTFTFPPDWRFTLSGVEGLTLEIIIVFFLLFFTAFFSLVAFALNNRQQAVMISILTTTYLFLRFIGLTQVLFLLFLIAIGLILGLVFQKRR